MASSGLAPPARVSSFKPVIKDGARKRLVRSNVGLRGATEITVLRSRNTPLVSGRDPRTLTGVQSR